MKFLTSSRSLKATACFLVAAVNCASLLVSIGPASAADPGAQIVGTEVDRQGTTVIMRQGTYNSSTRKGFGWTKVQRLHAIYSKHSVGFVLREYSPTVSGDITRYNAYAQKFRVIDGKRYLEEEVEVKVSVRTNGVPSYWGVELNYQAPGVLTAYCENTPKADKCPSWIDQAIGTHAPSRGVNDPDAPQFAGSYESFTVGEPIPESATLYLP